MFPSIAASAARFAALDMKRCLLVNDWPTSLKMWSVEVAEVGRRYGRTVLRVSMPSENLDKVEEKSKLLSMRGFYICRGPAMLAKWNAVIDDHVEAGAYWSR